MNKEEYEKRKTVHKMGWWKRSLLGQLQRLLPTDFGKWKDVTYIEPFVGGGAMLFYMLQMYPNIKRAIINDINPNLTQ